MRDESSIMCLSGCCAVRVTSPHLRFRHFLLLITVLLEVSSLISTPFPFICLLVSPALLSPVLSFSWLFPFVMLCTYESPDRTLWQPLKQDQVCVCVGVRQAKEQICRITSTALNCIRQLIDLFFYGCNTRKWTYQCHKVQQGLGTSTLRHACRR